MSWRTNVAVNTQIAEILKSSENSGELSRIIIRISAIGIIQTVRTNFL